MPEAITHEEWRPIPGWDNYDISCYGRVRREGRMLKLSRSGSRNKNGHFRLSLCLCRTGEIKRVAVAPLVLRTFVGPPLPGQECRHFPDRDPGNCHVENLRWGYRWENNLDKATQGCTGHNKRLTREEILEVRRLAASGVNQDVIAAQFGVTQGAVSAIHLGKVWRHIT